MNAAKVLRVSQPSISAQIKTLEAELSLSLFEKSGRRLVLTPDGERAYSFCRKIFEAAEEFEDYLKQSNVIKSHRCRIGVTHEIERPFIADTLSALFHNKTAREQPMLSMISEDHANLIENLKSGMLDAVITNHQPYGAELQIAAELSMPVVAVATPNMASRYSLQKKEAVGKLIKGKDVGFVLPTDRIKMRIETDLILQRLKLRNPVVFESDILAVVVRMALEGVGIAFLPKHYISRELNQESLVLIGDGLPLWQHTIFIASRNTKSPDPIVSQIKDHFVQLGARSPKAY